MSLKLPGHFSFPRWTLQAYGFEAVASWKKLLPAKPAIFSRGQRHPVAVWAFVPLLPHLSPLAGQGGLVHLSVAEGASYAKDDSVSHPAKLHISQRFIQGGKVANVPENVPCARAKNALGLACVDGRGVAVIDKAAL